MSRTAIALRVALGIVTSLGGVLGGWFAAGCAGSTVRAQTGTTAGLIATARESGALRCAPVELAMAESHNDFAQHELDEGNYHDARHEAQIAETNARLAIDKSPRDRCTDQQAPPPPPPGPGDKDGDGIPDNVDKCPNDPEDKDGFEDADGCPDLDNDKDGIPDAADKCPNDPEDKDGFEDADGCPDPDNDKDGIPDAADKCPNVPRSARPARREGLPEEVQPRRRHRHQDRAQADRVLRHQQGHDQARVVRAAR